MQLLTVESIIGSQVCQNGRSYLLSSLGQMPLETGELILKTRASTHLNQVRVMMQKRIF